MCTGSGPASLGASSPCSCCRSHHQTQSVKASSTIDCLSLLSRSWLTKQLIQDHLSSSNPVLQVKTRKAPWFFTLRGEIQAWEVEYLHCCYSSSSWGKILKWLLQVVELLELWQFLFQSLFWWLSLRNKIQHTAINVIQFRILWKKYYTYWFLQRCKIIFYLWSRFSFLII